MILALAGVLALAAGVPLPPQATPSSVLAQELVDDVSATQVTEPTSEPEPLATEPPTSAPTEVPTTAPATVTPAPTSTSATEPTPVPTDTPAATPTVAETSYPTATSTAVPPTATEAPVFATSTPVPPTETPASPAQSPTSTQPPAPTPTQLPTGTLTLAPSPTQEWPTATASPTSTVVPVATTSGVTPAATPEELLVDPTPVSSLEATPTGTPTTTLTPTPTATPVVTATFGRTLSGSGVGQHEVLPLTTVTVSISATVSTALPSVTLTDYFPSSWQLVSLHGGEVSSSGGSGIIAWSLGPVAAGEVVSASYEILSPVLEAPPASYGFVSELAWAEDALYSEPWQVTVADPSAVLEQTRYRIGKDTSLAAMDWYLGADTPASGLDRGVNLRVRFQVANGSPTAATWAPQMEWATSTGGPWSVVATSSGTGPFFVSDTGHYSNGAPIPTGSFALGPGTGTARDGTGYDAENPGGSVELGANSYSEMEFNIQATGNALHDTQYYFRLTNGGDALGLYSNYAQASFSPLVVKSARYRIGKDASLSEMEWHAGPDLPVSNLQRDSRFRVRFQLYNDSPVASSWAPQLEWAASTGSWAVVPVTSGDGPFFVADTPQYSNETPILASHFGVGVGAGTAQNGVAYDTQNPGSTFVLAPNAFTEVEFVVQANGNAANSTTYFFRLSDAGRGLTSYSSYAQVSFSLMGLKQARYRLGEDTPLASMEWYGGVDTPATWLAGGASLRARFQVSNDTAASVTFVPRLEWAAVAGGPWTPVPVGSASGPFLVADSAEFGDGVAIPASQFSLGAGIGGAQDGVAYDSRNPGQARTLGANTHTEIEFSLRVSDDATSGDNYYLRLSDDGTPLTQYGSYAEVSIAPPPPTHADSGGYSPTSDACAKCHRGTHGSDVPALTSSNDSTEATQESVCYTCHDGTGSEKNVQAQFLKSYSHPVGMNDLHRFGESAGAQFSGASRHVECSDCHSAHYAAGSERDGGSSLISGILQRVSGVVPDFSGAWTTPEYSYTASPVREAEVCLKCHSGWAYGQNPPPAPSGLAQTDPSMEFNPANRAVHPIWGLGKNQSPNLPDSAFVWPWSKASTLYCTDCHGSDAPGDPSGAHGSSNRWILKASNPPGSGSTAEEKVLCFNCHSYDVYYKGGAGSRVTHPVDSSYVDNGANVFGIWCLNCHGGDVQGGIHGTNQGVGSVGSSPLGDHFMNGAAIAGFTDAGSSVTIYTKSATDQYLLKGFGADAGGRSISTNYDY